MSALRDVVVLLPGITGSVLANAQGKEIWESVGRRNLARRQLVRRLDRRPRARGQRRRRRRDRAAPDPRHHDRAGPGQDRRLPEDRALPRRAVGLTSSQNFFPFPYDWRLDNRVNARRLEREAMNWLTRWRTSSGAADAKLVLVGHSMGGLISRYFLECLGGWQHTRTLITLGTPHRGSVNAVDSIVNGVKKGIGPLGLDLTPLLRSYPSVYQLLPTYPCVDTGTGGLQRIATATESGALPVVRAEWAREARAFHTEIEDAQKRNAATDAYRDQGYRLIPVVGIEQPTHQSVAAKGGSIELLRSYEGQDMGGDGTVPRVSATPLELSDALREVYAAETHGSLQNADGPLSNVKGVLTRADIDLGRFRAELPTALTLDLGDVVLAGEPMRVRARASEGRPTVTAHLTHLASGETLTEPLGRSGSAGWQQVELALAPGTWRVRIEPRAHRRSPISRWSPHRERAARRRDRLVGRPARRRRPSGHRRGARGDPIGRGAMDRDPAARGSSALRIPDGRAARLAAAGRRVAVAVGQSARAARRRARVERCAAKHDGCAA